MKKLTDYQLHIFSVFFGSIISTGCMISGMLIAAHSSAGNHVIISVCSAVSFFLLSVTANFKSLLMTDKYFKKVQYITGILYLVLAGLSGFIVLNPLLIYRIIGISFMVLVVLFRGALLYHKHKLRNILFDGAILVIALTILIAYCTSFDVQDIMNFPLLYGLIIALISFLDILRFIFANFRQNVLIKIMRNTYTFEILYGLVALIVATSLLLYMTGEPKIKSFVDGLWYCFAVVTTIGFGDMVCVYPIGRVLTVLLGIYGIIVVALVTSIIVNFYNEISPKKDTKKDDEVKELVENSKVIKKIKEKREAREATKLEEYPNKEIPEVEIKDNEEVPEAEIKENDEK